jgi:hypothetical protein
VNAVFPLPLGPTSRKVGRVAEVAAFLYKKPCSRIGNPIATMKVMRMVVRFGENALVSQLSSSYHAMFALQFTSSDARSIVDNVYKQRRDAQRVVLWLRDV